MTSSLANYKTEALSASYDNVRIRHSKALVSLLSRYLPDNAKILEVGPGHGHFLRAAAAAGMLPDAIEPSDDFRSRLVDSGIDISTEEVPPIRRPDNSYDLINACMVLENLPTSREAGEFACEAHRVLRPGGIISLIFPDYMTWGRFFFDEHYTHSFITTEERVRHLLSCQGFEVIRTEHVLGWYWVENTPLRAVARHICNTLMWPLHTRFAYWLMRYTGLRTLHWKIRKTLFPAIVMIARRSP
jgi:SAM-dependent methyltransferase